MTEDVPPTIDMFNNIPANENVVAFGKPAKNTVEAINKPPAPLPQNYQFRLVDGSERVLSGFLMAGPGVVMIGDENETLMYLAPVDSLIEVVRL